MKQTKIYSRIALGLIATTLSAQAEQDKATITGAGAALAVPGNGKSGKELVLRAEAAGPVIGIGVEMLTDEARAKYPNLKPGVGLEVSLVMEGSDAAAAGLQKGDVLLSWNGDSLVHPEQLRVLVYNSNPELPNTLGFLHDGKEQEIQLKVKEPMNKGVVNAHAVAIPADKKLIEALEGGNVVIKGGVVMGKDGQPIKSPQDQMIDDIAKMMKADGVPEAQIEEMRKKLRAEAQGEALEIGGADGGGFSVGGSAKLADPDKAKAAPKAAEDEKKIEE